MNDTLLKRKTELQDRQGELVKQVEDVDKEIQRLLKAKEQLIANHNAISGALQLVDELIVEKPYSAPVCECQPTSQ